MPNQERLLITGAGVAGLTCSLALAQAGRSIQLLEQATGPSHEGAGLQLGPNVTARLRSLGLLDALLPLAGQPQALRLRRLSSHATLARLPLGSAFTARYRGVPYLTIHRADLIKELLSANLAVGVQPQWSTRIEHVRQTDREVQVRTQSGQVLRADGLIGADGIWSRCRLAVPAALNNPPRPVGQIAFRGLISDTSQVPAQLLEEVTVWTRPGLHLVGYPVRAGRAYNLVALCPIPRDWQTASQGWGQPLPEAVLKSFEAKTHKTVRSLLSLATPWHAWAMQANEPLASAEAMHLGRVILLGDAAHALRPHLAQGAGMAIEDAHSLAKTLLQSDAPLHMRLAQAAQDRWQRNAEVQRASARNGQLFQMRAPWVWGRDLALRLLGPRLMDQPWLYSR
ncbi:MAG: FAD-dependent monooxygenase [Burkholderiaceae bacterium]